MSVIAPFRGATSVLGSWRAGFGGVFSLRSGPAEPARPPPAVRLSVLAGNSRGAPDAPAFTRPTLEGPAARTTPGTPGVSIPDWAGPSRSPCDENSDRSASAAAEPAVEPAARTADSRSTGVSG